MKHRVAEFVFVMILLFVTVFNMIGMAVSAFGYDLTHLPQGKFLYSAMSPGGNATLKIYRVEVARIGTGIRGELVTTNEAGETVTKNIYWETDADSAIAAWTGDSEVRINDHVVDINGEPYDSRTEVELPEITEQNLLN